MIRFFMTVLVFSFSLQVMAEDKKEESTNSSEDKSTYVMCKNGNVVRTIRIELKGQSCRAFYTKQGVDKEVGKSATPAVCHQVTDRIRKNLEASSWKCKDISHARVSSSRAD